MVINHDNKWIYLAAPKTGSSTLHYMLSFPPFNGTCPGMGCDRNIHPITAQHDMNIPEGCEDYKILVSVRDPFSRAVSLFTHFEKHLSHLPLAKSFPIYVNGMLLPKVNDFFGWTCSRWYENLPRVDHVIRLECMLEDVQKSALVDTPFSLPWENRITSEAWQNYYRFNPGTLELVRQWGDEDFDRYGYGR